MDSAAPELDGLAGAHPALEHTYHSAGRVGGLTHGLYRYPARFSPELARSAVDTFTRPGDTVLDPFVGGGTAAVEALARGRRFVGFDLNPLALLLTQVKTDPIPRDELDQLTSWVRARHDPVPVDPGDDRLRNAPPGLVAGLSPRLASVDGLASSRARLAARALLLDVAQWAVDGRREQVPLDALAPALERSLERLQRGMAELATLAAANGVRPSEMSGRRVLRLGRAETIATSRPLNRVAGRVRLVITSPPYPGVHVLYHRWQVGGRSETPMAYWLADANDGLGPKHYTMGGRSRLGEDAYFDGIQKTWAGVRRLLRNDAVVVQLVAFSDVESQLPRYLDAMSSAGYRRRSDLEPDGWRDVPNRRWYYRVRPTRGAARERLLAHAPVG